MTSQTRDTLRDYFGEGRLPTNDHFSDLIDSMLNMRDEGFRKSITNGFEVSTPVGHNALISFYRDERPRTALWSLRYGGSRDQLLFQPGSAAAQVPPTLALDAQARVGINTAEPRYPLDVAGVVAAQGRIGTAPQSPEAKPLLADGEWHDLTGTMTGCQAFEVVAGVGGAPGAGRYALVHATALNTFNPSAGWFDFLVSRKRIRCTHAYYGRRCDKLQLRWATPEGAKSTEFRLQIRTRCDYGPNVKIRAHLTRLWFDDTMQGSAP